ncbi:MAG: Holliday junction branch migration protein RuvA [Candidatus Falkowbacteria bacterium]
MIAYLKGKVLHKNNTSAVIVVNNIGYMVALNAAFLGETMVDDEIEVYTHQHVREDAVELFGFKNLEDLELFELLISISGVGPKTGLGVFSLASAGDIKEAIARGDSGLLTKVSGIGKKTAERIVLELRDKVGQLAFYDKLSGAKTLPSSDEIDALMTLGYSLQQAREALAQIDPSLKDSSEKVRAALKMIGK